MKTPKRITYCECGCALNLESGDYMDDKGKFYNATALFCPKCGAAHPGDAFAARCIRKNREARLRHKIYWQARDIEWLAETNKRMRKKCAGLAALLVLADIQHDCDVGNFNASGTYGHDIEGS